MRFVHSPLQDGEIRILHLQEDSSGALQCHIDHVSIGSAAYIALSYAWEGSVEEFQLPILQHDGPEIRTLPLTRNLHSALQDLIRSTISPKTFWVDQICIDQSNQSEKEVQIKLMRQVYRDAKLVVTYAGPRKPEDDIGLQLFEELSADYIVPYYDCFKQDYAWEWLADVSNGLSIVNNGAKRSKIAQSGTALEEALKSRIQGPLPSHSGWPALMRILLGSWGRRKWMIQENILNSDTVILRGSRRINHHHVLILCGILRFKLPRHQGPRISFATDAERRHLANVSHLWRIIRVLSTGGTVSLEELLHWFRDSLCSDDRDRVYALSGLAHDVEKLGIEPDYSKKLREILIDTSVAMLSHDGLRLYLRQRSLTGESVQGLPSWAFSWSAGSRVTGLIIGSQARAHVVLAKPVDTHVRFEENNLVMVLKSVQIGTVTKIFGDVKRGFDEYLRHSPRARKPRAPHGVGTTLQSMEQYLLSQGVEDLPFILGCAFLAKSTWTRHDQHHPLEHNNEFVEGPHCEQCAQDIRAGYESAMAILTTDDDLAGVTEDSGSGLDFIRDFGVYSATLCVIDGDIPCWAPTGVCEGDLVCKMVGGTAAFVLRHTDRAGHFSMIGLAYAQGCMDGEAYRLKRDWEDHARNTRVV